MNTRKIDCPSQHSQRILEALKLSVSKALEKKHRLGQYAVIWQNGTPVMKGADAPQQT